MVFIWFAPFSNNMDSLQKKYGGSRAPGFVYGEEYTLHKGVSLVSGL